MAKELLTLSVLANVVFAATIVVLLYGPILQSRNQLAEGAAFVPINSAGGVRTRSSSQLSEKERRRLSDTLSQKDVSALQKFVATLNQYHCRYDENSFRSLTSFLQLNTTEEKRIEWLNPVRRVIRSVNAESAVPCETESQYWIPDGSWQSIPMMAHSGNRGAAVSKCPSSVMMTPAPNKKNDATLLCPDFLRKKNDDCLIYTFGIARQWDFEDWAGSIGCEVHAHDPTKATMDAHFAHEAENVHFHYQGLGTPDGTARTSNSAKYGELGGDILTLGQLWNEHGHAKQNRPISMIKIDCEGCEWESFHQLATEEPEIMSEVCTIIMEVHVTETLQMKTPEQLKLMASFWQKYIEDFGFRFWFLHSNPGARFDRSVNPFLLDFGMDPNICCYEIALRRPECGL
mmetsp:Transcript_5235/g.14847  ORF Transcript_5235/g.14847 Transcript_5235/m.14847 type:complete len:402 (+) Transcript_5235:129-1334(+)